MNLILLVPLLFLAVFATSTQSLNTKKFPPNFLFGASTSAYQVEGGWNSDGKGESNWDRLSHSSISPIYNHHTGDIACDSYHKYKDDVALLKHLGVQYYRFSISWSRILPSGFNNDINQRGIQYYKNLLKELKTNGITPMVTIHHWDTPQPLEDLGGWTNELIVEIFVDYARVLFENFGQDVKYWQTFNEPKQTCQHGYGSGQKAPGIKSHGIGEYLCTHNVVKAHAQVWHMYDKEFRHKHRGLIGIAIDSNWMEPETDSELDKAAAERAIQFTYGWYANPIVHGDYSWQMKEFIARRSQIQGFSHSRLPEFTAEEKKYIKGSIDYLGLNQYTASLIRHVEDTKRTNISWEADSETFAYQPDHWEKTPADWFKVVPWSMRKLVNWISKTYNNIPLLITENGCPDDGATLEDDRRIYYYRETLSNLRDAMDDGARVIGYTAWSLMDNFEWYMGYKEKFGLYSVNFTSPERTRTPKKSVAFIKHVFETKCIVEEKDCISEHVHA